MLKRLFFHARILSLDIVAGALASGALARFVTQSPMRPVWWFVLALSVWLVYTLDHLLDGIRVGGQASTARHAFHYRHRKVLFFLSAIVFVIAGVLAWDFLAPPVFFLGIAVCAATVLHLYIIQKIGSRTSFFLQKEVAVALIYTVGVWGGPLVKMQIFRGTTHWTLLLLFFFLALSNLLLFALFEKGTDEADGYSSFVRALGESKASYLVNLLCAVVLCVSAGIIIKEGYARPSFACGAYIVMALIFLLLLHYPGYFRQRERYRVFGDAAFLLPVVPVWLWNFLRSML